MIHSDQKIVLMGYMAAGKSTIGKRLAEKLNYEFVDLDRYIEQKEGQSIDKIFEEQGETCFRTKELVYLKELLIQNQSLVIALGGGTPTVEGVLPLLKTHALSLYIYVKPEVLYERLKPKEVERPLLSDLSHDILKTYIQNHLKGREPYYYEADITIITNQKSVDSIVDRMVKFL